MTDRPLRIGFDVTPLLSGNTGVARYTRELARALDRRNVELVRFGIGRKGHYEPAELERVRQLRLPLRFVHRIWPVVRVPRGEWLAPGCAALHSPDLIPPPTRYPVVMTVHDLDAVERPDLHPPRAVRIQRAQLEAARDRAAVVLSVSKTTATALIEHEVDAERIVIAPNGVTRLPPADESLVPTRPYLLAVGALGLRKGYDRLVQAFAGAALGDVRLVLAGPDGWGSKHVYESIERSPAADRIICTGAVSDAQLAGLYRRCRAVCVPSIAEGFGLPVLEAGAMGAPVLASDIPALREVGECVTTFVPPDDALAWIRALEQIANRDPQEQQPRVRAQAFAERFTWDRTAAITEAAYRRAIDTDGR